MFKSKEDLIKEAKDTYKKHYDNLTYADGIRNAFQSISERIEFYERYEGDWFKFKTEQEKLYNKFVSDRPDILKGINQRFEREALIFNDWLFHFCFDGVK